MSRRRRRLRLVALVMGIAALAAAVVVLTSPDDGASPRGSPAAAERPAAHRPPPPRIVHGPHHRPVPILMYHVIDSPEPGAPYPDLYTPKPVFAAQMRALARAGYHGVTLRQVADYWRRAYALPRKPIVVSFDDGYRSHYTHARPVLQRLGWPGVLNLEVHNAQTPGDVSVPEVRAMIRAGWEVDSHTVTHPDLTTLPPDRLRQELVRSRRWLRRVFHVPVDYFCYPSGRYDATVIAAVKAAGYRLATTTNGGLAAPDRPYELNRIRVDGADGVDGLLQTLAAVRRG